MTLTRKFGLFLLPTLGRIGVGLVMLPLTTYVLNPSDFGIYVLVISISGLISAVAVSGLDFVVAGNFRAADRRTRQELISTCITVSFTIAVGGAGVLVTFWNLLAVMVEELSSVPEMAIWLAAGSIVLSMPWYYGIQIAMLDNRPGGYAVINLADVVISATAVLVSLYIFRLDVMSLFIGGITGAAVTGIGGLILLAPYLRPRLRRQWMIRLARVGGVSVLVTISERLLVLVERFTLVAHTGLADTGIYSHSQQYRNIVATGAKAMAYSVWPDSLDEARYGDSQFRKTKQAWDVVVLFISGAGLFFAAFGEDIIALLTHDKFTEAYVLAALWMVYLLVQNTGKPAIAMAYAKEQGVLLQVLLVMSTVLAILLLLVLVPVVGIYGAAAAALGNVVTFRLLIYIGISRRYGVPFHDKNAIKGLVSVLLVLGMVVWFQPDFMQRFVIFFIAALLISLIHKESVRIIAGAVRLRLAIAPNRAK